MVIYGINIKFGNHYTRIATFSSFRDVIAFFNKNLEKNTLIYDALINNFEEEEE